jgi:hypothetical protein
MGFEIDTKYIKSYKTKENLVKALKGYGIDDHRHLIVCTENGRFTAVFPQSNLKQHDICYMGYYGQFGFMIFG